MTNAIKIEFGFGVGKDRHQKFLTPREVRLGLRLIIEKAASLWGAYTLQPVSGGWTNPAGLLIEEPGYVLTITTKPLQTSHSNTRALIDVIKDSLRQEAVAVTQTPVSFEIL